MLDDLREWFYNFINSRVVVLFLVTILLTAVLMNRIFQLQIVHGSEYLQDFTLSIAKDVLISSTRGNIYDRNGNLIAYNEIANSVVMTDVLPSGKGKNLELNTIILETIRLIEKNGDALTTEFGIYLDENENYCYSLSGTQLQRFLADIYGRRTIDELLYTERGATPEDIIEFLASDSKYGIGSYFTTEDGATSFVPLVGYTKEEVLKIAQIRYLLSLNQFQKYLTTTIAESVSDKTVAAIMENSDILSGVTVQETTIRRYNYSECMAPVIGYTGRISQEEYNTYSESNPGYTLNDVVGKAGIELSMETVLQGTKGSETLYVDTLGRVLDRTSTVAPIAGNDITLTIDVELQNAIYRLLEQKIAGILVSRLENVKTVSNQDRNVMIPIYDVYYALFDNNILDISHFSKPYAGEYEKAVYERFLDKREQTLNTLENTLLTDPTIYADASQEMQTYERFIITMLSSSNYGILDTNRIDTTDPVYLQWRAEEISIKDYLMHGIAMQWVDISKLSLENQYSDSNQIYEALVDTIIEKLMTNVEFHKLLYKYMLLNDQISPRQVCMILWEQDIIQLNESERNQLFNGATTPYYFMKYLLTNLKITPAQLGLTPCSGSCVVTDPNSGQVLALVSYPGYNNNHLDLGQLSTNKSNPLWNYATQQRTAPGSTFKMVSAVAGVQENVITTGESITCTGVFDKLSGSVHKCWISPGSHGSETLSSAIGDSCNCYFYEVGYRLAFDGNSYNDNYGIDRIYRYADLFGLSEKSGVEIMESEPQVSNQYPVVSAIGQGTHSFTTVQLARYVSAVANSGTVYNLSLISEIHSASGELIHQFQPQVRNQIVLSDNLWNMIHYGMRQVVLKKAYFSNLGVTVAGKTGTAQEATNRANHALFVGYAPYENPQIAIATRIANGYNSDYTAQLAYEVIAYYFGLQESEDLITGTASEIITSGGGD